MVLIVDDHDILRQGVRNVLEIHDEWQVVGEAVNGEEALRLYQELKPDAVIMDIAMPVLGGLEATDKITKTNPGANVLILTMHESPILREEARRSGAKGLLSESETARELAPALKAILAGKTYFR